MKVLVPAIEDYTQVFKDLNVCRDCALFSEDFETEEEVRMKCHKDVDPWKGTWEYEDEFGDGYAPETCKKLDALQCIMTLREL